MGEQPGNNFSEASLSSLHMPAIIAMADWWSGFVPKDLQLVFKDTLIESLKRYLDRPQDARRGINAQWKPVTEYPIGVGVHSALSDTRLQYALISADVDESLLPHQTHTVLDIYTGDVVLHQEGQKPRRIFPIAPVLRE